MTVKAKKLSFIETVELINVAGKGKLSLKDFRHTFRITKNQTSHVLQEKEVIRKLWIINSNENSKTVKFRRIEVWEIDIVVFN